MVEEEGVPEMKRGCVGKRSGWTEQEREGALRIRESGRECTLV